MYRAERNARRRDDLERRTPEFRSGDGMGFQESEKREGGAGGGEPTPPSSSSSGPFRAVTPVGKGARTAPKISPLITPPVSPMAEARGTKEEERKTRAVEAEPAGRDSQAEAKDNPPPSEAAAAAAAAEESPSPPSCNNPVPDEAPRAPSFANFRAKGRFMCQARNTPLDHKAGYVRS